MRVAERHGGTARSALLATLAALAVTACAPLNALEDVMLPNGSMNVITGEVRSVDSSRGRLQVREEYGNRRTHTLRYDNRTRVTAGQRQYPASSLQRGDIVRVSVSHDRSGNAWADRVDVRQSARDQRTVSSNRVTRVEGVVRQVDNRRGHFTLEQSRSQTVRIHVPPRLSNNDARRFDRLRRGERVRAEVRHLGRDEAQLVRFR
jgi:hypothetical protein